MYIRGPKRLGEEAKADKPHEEVRAGNLRAGM